jgi:hypothetical protein
MQTVNMGLLATSGIVTGCLFAWWIFFLSEFGLARNIGWEPPPPVVKIRQNSSFFSQVTEMCHAKTTQQDHDKNRQIGGLSHHFLKSITLFFNT